MVVWWVRNRVLGCYGYFNGFHVDDGEDEFFDDLCFSNLKFLEIGGKMCLEPVRRFYELGIKSQGLI